MVLLVVFMAGGAADDASGIALNLPKVGGRNLTGKETSLNISVDSEGYYYIGMEEIPGRQNCRPVTAVRGNPKSTSLFRLIPSTPVRAGDQVDGDA